MYIIITIIIVIVVAAIFNSNKATELEVLKNKYHELLKGGDKRAALEAGRAYYSSLRNGKALTIYDEQAITNDLSTMHTPHSNIS